MIEMHLSGEEENVTERKKHVSSLIKKKCTP